MVHNNYLAGEGQEVLVDVLGSQAVAGVLLGILDVGVDELLRLEPLVTAEYIKHYDTNYPNCNSDKPLVRMDARPCGP